MSNRIDRTQFSARGKNERRVMQGIRGTRKGREAVEGDPHKETLEIIALVINSYVKEIKFEDQ